MSAVFHADIPHPPPNRQVQAEGARVVVDQSAVDRSAAEVPVDQPDLPHDTELDSNRQIFDPPPADEPTGGEVGPDFPEATALSRRTEYLWDEEKAHVEHFAALGGVLAAGGDLYRSSAYGGGLMLGSTHPHVPPAPIESPGQLQPIIMDRVVVKLNKRGNIRYWIIPPALLRTMLGSEAFLQKFRAVDEITDVPRYLSNSFRLTAPGYNDGGYRRRILYTGRAPWILAGLDHINRFLDVMDFASEADRANALAAALIVLLRNMWPGGKPIVIVTSTKSHGGKETIITFIALGTMMVSISYQETDWALERQFVAALKQDPKTGLINVDNARLGKQRNIQSAFLERFLTDPEPFLHSTGTGRPVRCPNDKVLAMSSNFGSMSGDLMNRALPIRLNPAGDVMSRRSPIGNPKLQYLPTHRKQITAELRGMIEVWKAAGRPMDTSKHHPFTDCIRTVGGILMANGVTGFLDNLHARRTVDDPVRHALGLLGTASLDESSEDNPEPAGYHEPKFWAAAAERLGLVKALIPAADRDTDSGRARAMGIILTAHRGETFELETDDHRLLFRLEKARRRFDPGSEPSTRYRFEVVSRAAIPADEDGQ